MTALPLPPGQSPRQWQLDALDALRASIPPVGQFQRVIVSAATGTGKGSLMAGITVLAAWSGTRVLLLAHRDELVAELVARIQKIPDAPTVGVVKAERDEWLHDIVVASVQSITKTRRERMGRFDLVLTDEAHHAIAPRYRHIYEAVEAANPDWVHIGFTATPFRAAKDGGTSGLGKAFDAVVYEYGIRDAIDNGDLVPLRAFNVSTDLSLAGVEIGSDGDYKADQLSAIVDCEARNDLVVSQYLERCPGLPALVFGASVAHAQHLAEAFQRRGITAAAVWGDMPLQTRRDLIGTFRRHPERLPVLCSKDLIFEGFDAPETRAILKARPTQSRVVFTQMPGRGMRTAPGKTECIFIDLVDNGCDLDLSTVYDLSDEDAEGKKKKPLSAGDRVMRRHHDDWGVGCITSLGGDPPVATVEWPVSRVHPDGDSKPHPIVELKRAPKDPQDEEGGKKIEPRVSGVRVYEVFLLRQSGRRKVVGWYAWADSFTASGRQSGFRHTFHVTLGPGQRWEVWTIQSPQERHPNAPQDVVTMLHDCASYDLAIAWAEQHIRAAKLKVSGINEEWKGQAATESQLKALAAWHVQYDQAGIGRGEASALLDAVIAHRKVSGARKKAKGRAA